MALSSTYGFNPNLGEVTIAAFSRIGVRRPEITQQHMSDARFEANLLQSDMQGDGIQLYQVILETMDIVPGKSAYPIDTTTVFMLDVYIRQNAGIEGIWWDNDNQSVEKWENNIDYTLAWGATPGYNPYSLFINQSVTWANVNNVVSSWTNQNSVISVWTGLQVPQVIAPVPDAELPLNTTSIDRIIMPISRTDYASIANKNMPGFPTSYWYDKILQPTMYLWPVPNQYIPQGLQFYVMKRPQDAELADGTQIQIPYEYYDYYVWGLAERLAYIYAPDRLQIIGPRKQQAWQRAMQASTENVPINIDTMLGSYYRVG